MIKNMEKTHKYLVMCYPYDDKDGIDPDFWFRIEADTEDECDIAIAKERIIACCMGHRLYCEIFERRERNGI